MVRVVTGLHHAASTKGGRAYRLDESVLVKLRQRRLLGLKQLLHLPLDATQRLNLVVNHRRHLVPQKQCYTEKNSKFSEDHA